MNQKERQLLPLWDFGWLDHDEITLAPSSQPQDLIGAYLQSNYFGSSFVGPSPADHGSDLHGPFRRSLITPSDFSLISAEEFSDRVQRVRQPEGFPEPVEDEQWRAVETLVAQLQPKYSWLIALGLTEDDTDRFHEWGYVHSIFREFILANPDSAPVSRLVFGYD